ncbi:MAG: serine/threonine protein kinase [Myxococcaceae bacterium]|nr:serine/threonine protein kinase [Myxococcaceae bacterium]
MTGPGPRGPAQPVLDAPLEEGQLSATLTESGFAETVRSGETPMPKALVQQLSLTPPPSSGGDGLELDVRGVLGGGGMGQVLLAYQRSLHREVAVKVLRAPSAESAALLVQEARLTGGLEHPGIVPVHALGSDDAGWPLLVMKRVEGVSWAELLGTSGDPRWAAIAPGGDQLEANLRILVQVCQAVAFAHRRGVLHRDLKPANVMVGQFGEVYVADWGIATRRDALVAGPLVGTPAYLAPEMARGDAAAISERTDVFLLGATLHELLTGRPPWSGATLREALEQAASGRPPPLPPDANPELAAVCRKAMAAAPEARFAGALDLRDALEQVLRHRGAAAVGRAAQARTEALARLVEGGGDDAQLYALLAEARFGFRQVLEAWPESPDGRAGLTRCLTLGADHELRRGRPAAARALLAELPSVSPELEARLVQAERAELAAKEHAAKLEREALHADPEVALRPRVYFASAMGLFIIVLGGIRAFEPSWFERTEVLAFISAAYNATFAILALVFRKPLLPTRLNERLALFVVALLTMQLTVRVHGAFVGKGAAPTLLQELSLLAAMLVGGAFAFHWSFLVGAAIAAAGAMVFSSHPELTVAWYTPVTFGTVAGTVVCWRAWRRRDEPLP